MFISKDDESSGSRLITSLIDSILNSKNYKSSAVLLTILTDQYGLSSLATRKIIDRLEEITKYPSSAVEFESGMAELLRIRPCVKVETILELVVSMNNQAKTLIDRLGQMKLMSPKSSNSTKNLQIFSVLMPRRVVKSNVF